MEKQNKNTYIYWDRVVIALCIFVLIIIFIIMGIKGIVGLFSGDKQSEKAVQAVKTNAAVIGAGQELLVCIDAGHGGEEDCGALSNDESRFESNDDLNIALAVEKYLQELGADVIMTRNDDAYVELYSRPEMANDADADIYVSLHRNSAESGQGVEVWVNYDAPDDDTLLAKTILKGLDNVGISQNRGVQFGYQGYDPTAKVNYVVNEKSNMPSCLVELGFITDDEDNELFDKNLDAYAKSIAESIVKSAEELNIVELSNKAVEN